MKKKRIIDRKRFERASMIIVGMINSVLFIGLILIFMLIIPKNTVEAESAIYENYNVCQGETLWSIASENKKDGQDVREYIYQLQKINSIKDCLIYPGQVIKIIK